MTCAQRLSASLISTLLERDGYAVSVDPCSTPFGIIDFDTRRWICCLAAEICAQRLSASLISTQHVCNCLSPKIIQLDLSCTVLNLSAILSFLIASTRKPLGIIGLMSVKYLMVGRTIRKGLELNKLSLISAMWFIVHLMVPAVGQCASNDLESRRRFLPHSVFTPFHDFTLWRESDHKKIIFLAHYIL